MTVLEFLQQRASIPAKYLGDPAPDDNQINEIIKAGIAAPDHAALRPWRFLTIRGDARNALGEVFVQASKAAEPDLPPEKLSRMREKPLRSPLIIAVIATITPEHPKTPVIEQVLSAGAAAQQMQLAATALGFGSVWLTGPNAHNPVVKAALGVAEKDEIIGFLYMGTPTISAPKPGRPRVEDHVQSWEG